LLSLGVGVDGAGFGVCVVLGGGGGLVVCCCFFFLGGGLLGCVWCMCVLGDGDLCFGAVFVLLVFVFYLVLWLFFVLWWGITVLVVAWVFVRGVGLWG
jgi:hypothetical protein